MTKPHRHDLVATFVAAYHTGGESLEQEISDLIADLLHYADTLPSDERINSEGGEQIGITVAEKAIAYYEEEIG